MHVILSITSSVQDGGLFGSCTIYVPSDTRLCLVDLASGKFLSDDWKGHVFLKWLYFQCFLFTCQHTSKTVVSVSVYEKLWLAYNVGSIWLGLQPCVSHVFMYCIWVQVININPYTTTASIPQLLMSRHWLYWTHACDTLHYLICTRWGFVW